MPAHFYSVEYANSSEIPFLENTIFIHGEPLDERGKLALAIDDNKISKRLLISYDVLEFTITVNGVKTTADCCETLLAPLVVGKNVVFETTTLGFAELFSVMRALITLGVRSFQAIYAEPKDYARPPNASSSYELSELIVGFHPIPHAVIDLSSDEVEAGVFFLGYESERIAAALEEFQMISYKDVKIVFGVPAFRAGWELNSIIPHLEMLNSNKFTTAYCSANDPGSAYDCLELTRSSIGVNSKMFIAPIGTKPCGIAASVFACLYPKVIGLLYDHPRKSIRRSNGVNAWHRYSVRLDI